MTMKTYDIAIIGAGIIGMAAASFLTGKKVSVAIIDKSHPGAGSTFRCIGGLRQQFSTPGAIRLMKRNMELYALMRQQFGFSVDFHQGGYLLLAHTPEMTEIFKTNIRTQTAEGVNASLLTPEEAQRIVPDLNIRGLLSAAYCPGDGQASPFLTLKGYKQEIDRQKGHFYLYNAVARLEKKQRFILSLQDGARLEAEKVLLCAGPWSAGLAAQAGLDLPLFPERHEAFITPRLPKFIEPMLVDYRPDGCYFQQLVTGQVIACFTPIPNVPGIREDVSFEFMPQLAQRMIRLIPRLKSSAVLRQWAGSYTMTPDGNPIVDVSEIEDLYIASGMCGHGFMFGPAIGEYLADFMLTGKAALDLSEFALHREFKGKEKLK